MLCGQTSTEYFVQSCVPRGSLRTCVPVVHGLMSRESEDVEQDDARLSSMLSGARCPSSSPHYLFDLVAKALEFSSEARSHLRVALT